MGTRSTVQTIFVIATHVGIQEHAKFACLRHTITPFLKMSSYCRDNSSDYSAYNSGGHTDFYSKSISIQLYFTKPHKHLFLVVLELIDSSLLRGYAF